VIEEYFQFNEKTEENKEKYDQFKLDHKNKLTQVMDGIL